MPPKPRQNVFGPFLVELRKERGKRPLTQEELANLLGMSRSTLANIENGRRLPTGEFLVALADLFHTSRYDRTELLRTLQIKALIQRYPDMEELFKYDENRSEYINEMMPDEVVEHIRTYMQERGWTERDLCEDLGYAYDVIVPILRFQRPVSRPMLKNLESYFKVRPASWQVRAGYLPKATTELLRLDAEIAAFFERLVNLSWPELSRFVEETRDRLPSAPALPGQSSSPAHSS